MKHCAKKVKDDGLVINELGVGHGTARVDVAVMQPQLFHGYEIKSDYDTLKRLPVQVCEFSDVFDRMTLVVGRQHIIEAMEIVPDWWGVMCVFESLNNEIVLVNIRTPEDNPDQYPVEILRLMWKQEALDFLKKLGKDKGMRYKKRDAIYDRLASVSSVGEIKQEVFRVVKARKTEPISHSTV